MNQYKSLTIRLSLLVLAVAVPTAVLSNARVHASEPVTRVPWTTSKLIGSPDPPLPYILERAYPLEFAGPISINRLPDSELMLVSEQKGRIFCFDAAQPNPQTHLFADFNANPPPLSGVQVGGGRRIELFSVAFHPQFSSNNYAYVCYITLGDGRPTETHIARFQVAAGEAPTLGMDSEFELLKCEGGGHNGCTVAFGPDGYLYISLGDLESPNPPDPRNTGQDISDLYSSILRIDVDQPSEGRNYSIPSDNPFIDLPGARGEVYSYGYRNPFRMAFDPETGDLWVGDVGWEAWEMVYRAKPGGNYGWSITEGPGLVKREQALGPTPILPADIALGHAEAASVTGGMVYRGQLYPDLDGTYIFGDWITRKFWAASFDTERVTGYREIAFGNVKPVCFESTKDGELLILDYADANQLSGIHRFVPNPALKESHPPFPRRLSETGLFSDTAGYVPAPGVLEYRVNAPMWKDGASADFLIAIPGEQTATFYREPQKTFDWFKTKVRLPRHTALVKTYSWPQAKSEQPARRIETQIAVKDQQGEWQYYTYRWNAESTDAELVDAMGETEEVSLDGHRDEQLIWSFGSRTSCRVCHTPWRGESLGFVDEQLRQPQRDWDSWRELFSSGLAKAEPETYGPDLSGHRLSGGRLSGGRLSGGLDPRTDLESVSNAPRGAMVDPHDAGQPLDLRARSYLHGNCSHCHLFGGNASTIFDLSFDKPLPDTKMMDEPPMRGDLGLTGSRIIRPGHPAESILFYRVAKSGSGRMPHVGSERTDPLAISLLKQWIAQLPEDPDRLKCIDLVCGPYPDVDLQQRLTSAKRLLESTEGAIELASAMAEGRVPQTLVHSIVEEAMRGPPAVRDLLEPFAAIDQRIPRLGMNFDSRLVLDGEGDSAAGERLFASGVGTCSNCHRAGTSGQQIGPDLSHVATRLKTKQAILDSILHPSAEINKDYVTKLVLTVDGDVLTGNIVEQTAERLTLRDANGKLTVMPADLVESVKASPVSLMPENLLSSLTAQQAADLLAYLTTLE